MSACTEQVARSVALPHPIPVPLSGPSVLAFGADMKNAICLTSGGSAFLSESTGEMGDLDALLAAQQCASRFERLLGVRPRSVAHDLHPDSRAADEARSRARRDRLPAVAVQHHHAHAAACMADNAVPDGQRVIGVCFDGTGYGPDGTIWGGEFLICDYRGFHRAAHLHPVALPGGDAGIRRPYRMALSWMRHAGIPWTADLPPAVAAGPDERRVLDRQLRARINTPLTSSMGRLFDAMASLIGLCHRIASEAEAPIALESLASQRAVSDDGAYAFERVGVALDPGPLLRDAAEDLRRGASPSVIACRFHRGVARMVVDECRRLREGWSINDVALTGGVWQNRVLVRMTGPALEREGFRVLVHRRSPVHDGGIALGQAVVALARLGGAGE